ncbi:hypothetical protein H6G17_08925 [Chroococcidiopsis sp. FACHB-1243]|uniref:hypothetical protein n=1 Tax=Chroococcidiopsis sp. [FACHB-1243] TaxID=2692781 RepID=UPI00178127AE|nr:hypothetical protein [Chroococcidiopsis sp. [FACHB-1243]]MBD2305639.1 hypothetical protein [Chroococcidiopsis sp. [FACHB-1243]]
MNNTSAIENEIYQACDEYPRNFTLEEMDYIRSHPDIQDILICWFEMSLSDGCWTQQQVKFMQSFYEC